MEFTNEVMQSLWRENMINVAPKLWNIIRNIKRVISKCLLSGSNTIPELCHNPSNTMYTVRHEGGFLFLTPIYGMILTKFFPNNSR